MNKSNVEKLRKNNYKEIYEKRVLPQKGVISHTLETYEATLKVFEDFSSYRERVNEKEIFKAYQNRKNNLWDIAEKNTKRNSDGLTVCSKDDPWREESEWDEITVHPKVKDGKLLFDRNNKDHRYIVDEEY